MKSEWRRRVPILAIGILAVTAIALFSDLPADPPGELDRSAGLVFDPPSKAHTARNRILFGEWNIDEWTPYIHGPFYSVVQSTAFSIGGVNLFTLRFPGALFTLVAIVLAGGLMTDRFARVLVWLIMGANVMLIFYGRSGLMEPQVIGWIMLSAFALQRGMAASDADASRTARVWLWAGGAAAAAAVLTKTAAAPFVLSALMVCALHAKRRGWILLHVALPLLLALLVYVGPFMRANLEFFDREVTYWIGRATAQTPWHRWSRQPLFHYLPSTRGLLFLAFLALPLQGFGRRRTPALQMLGLTLVIGSQLVAFVEYRPVRYYIVSYAVALPLAAWMVRRSFDVDAWASGSPPGWRRTAGRITGAIVLAFSLNFAVIYPWSSARGGSARFPLEMRLAAALFFSAMLVAAYSRFQPRLRALVVKLPVRGVQTGLLAFWLLLGGRYVREQIGQYRHWWKPRQHIMQTFSRDLGNRYRDVRVAGISPLFAVIENRHVAHKVTPYNLNWGVMTPEQVSHLLIPDGWMRQAFFPSRFPEIWSRAEPVGHVRISDVGHVLLAVNLQPARVESFTPSPSGFACVLVNPDPRTPQRLGVVAWHPTDPGEAPAETSHPAAILRDLLPGESISTFAPWNTPPSIGTTVTAYVLNPAAFRGHEPRHAGILGGRWITDPRAISYRAVRLAARPARSAVLQVDLPSADHRRLLALGLRLRGRLAESSPARLEALTNDGTPVAARTLLHDELTESNYAPILLRLDPPRDVTALRLTSESGAVLVSDAAILLYDDAPPILPDGFRNIERNPPEP